MVNLYGPWERRRLACPRQGFGTAKPLPYNPNPYFTIRVMEEGRNSMSPETTELLVYPDEMKDVQPQELVPTPEDPFPYGWRYVTIQRNGEEELLQVPLTLDDVLHPEEEDFVIQLCTVVTHRLFDYLKTWCDARPLDNGCLLVTPFQHYDHSSFYWSSEQHRLIHVIKGTISRSNNGMR
jgi:hypothetical protein